MLLLTRYKDESIIMTTAEGRIEVMIMRVSTRGKVQLAITAPKTISVHRKEIQLEIDNERRLEDGAKSNNASQTH